MTDNVDILTMEEGLTLDQIIAERLGWTDIEKRHGWWETPGAFWEDDYLIGRSPADPIGHEDVPCYSHDLEAAFSLPLSTEYRWQIYGPVSESDTWDAEIVHNIAGRPYWSGAAPTLALALCRAWLRKVIAP